MSKISSARRPTAPPRPLEPEIRTWLEPSRWRLPAVLGKWALDPAYRHQPAGEQKLVLKGEMTLPHPFEPALDPVSDGAQLRVRDAAGDDLLLVDIPAGAFDKASRQGWKGNRAQTKFAWKSKSGVDGITKVSVVAGNKKAPGLVRFVVTGKTVALAAVEAGQLPLEARLLLDPEGGSTGQCGDALFDADSGRACELAGNAKKVTCK